MTATTPIGNATRHVYVDLMELCDGDSLRNWINKYKDLKNHAYKKAASKIADEIGTRFKYAACEIADEIYLCCRKLLLNVNFV